eukprot:scaffold44204_cov39-Phaeocystis_antarctica.AAC.1
MDGWTDGWMDSWASRAIHDSHATRCRDAASLTCNPIYLSQARSIERPSELPMDMWVSYKATDPPLRALTPKPNPTPDPNPNPNPNQVSYKATAPPLRALTPKPTPNPGPNPNPNPNPKPHQVSYKQLLRLFGP